MTKPVTVLAPIVLAKGKTETDLMTASERFQKEFVSQQTGIIRRELVKRDNDEYLDIIQFRSKAHAEEVMKLERESQACIDFFSVMDFTKEVNIEMMLSLATYQSK